MQRYALSPILAILAGLASGGARCGEEAEPPNPFGAPELKRSDAVPGKLVRSDAKVHRGGIFLTRDKRLELYCDSEKKWHNLKLKDIKSIKWEIEFEKQEREWRWKQSGSDVKVYTGREKVDRRYKAVVVKNDCTKIEGHLRGTVVYVQPAKGKRQKFFVYWNHPGDFDQKPEDLIYTSEIHFGDEHAREPKAEAEGSEKGVAATKEPQGKPAKPGTAKPKGPEAQADALKPTAVKKDE